MEENVGRSYHNEKGGEQPKPGAYGLNRFCLRVGR